ncbi:MAG: FHA domain-containing protein [Armatimonadota bacterium]
MKIFLMFIVGGAAGLLGWALVEPSAPAQFHSRDWTRWELLFALTTGGVIGLALGGLTGLYQGSRAHFLIGALVGGALGAVGGMLGLSLGEDIAHTFFSEGVFLQRGIRPDMVIARTLVFAPFGALIGLVVGASARSLPRALQGALGGLIGGAIGGSLFDLIGAMFSRTIVELRGVEGGVTEVGLVSRAIAMTAIGGFVGLLIGIVEMMARKAWVRLEVGRNEGKEWVVDAHRTFIGRSETAHIPLFGDPNVAPLHACIERRGGEYVLLDSGTPVGIGVNGIRVPQATLKHGDVVNVGSHNLRFLLRNPRASAPVTQSQPPETPPAGVPVSSAGGGMVGGAIPGATPAATPPMGQAGARLPSVAPSPAFFVLVAVDGPASGRRYPLPMDTEVVAGREASDINLAGDSAASRVHAAFRATLGGVQVRDLNSTNGTFVNGVKAPQMTLREGDIVRIGSTTFRLERSHPA